MAKWQKFLDRVLEGRSDRNISFHEMCHLLARMGFKERIEDDHHIFTKVGVQGLIDLQPQNSMCKPYQVKQARKLFRMYNMITVE